MLCVEDVYIHSEDIDWKIDFLALFYVTYILFWICTLKLMVFSPIKQAPNIIMNDTINNGINLMNALFIFGWDCIWILENNKIYYTIKNIPKTMKK